jgi:dTDP-4-dehydrorhamnose 3,5-epimerase
VTSDSAEFVYKCTDYYAPQFDQSVLWNDPALNIQWPLVDGKLPLLSAKDQAGLLHADAPAF